MLVNCIYNIHKKFEVYNKICIPYFLEIAKIGNLVLNNSKSILRMHETGS